MCHGLCSALGLVVLGIINAYIYIYIYFDRFTWSLQAIWQHWDFSFSFSSQIGQLPLLLISRSQTQYRSLPRKGRNNEHRTPQVSPGRQHKDLLLELRGLERSDKARCHLLEQRAETMPESPSPASRDQWTCFWKGPILLLWAQLEGLSENNAESSDNPSKHRRN